MLHDGNQSGYKSWGIELDAIAFAHKMMLEFFEVKTVIQIKLE